MPGLNLYGNAAAGVNSGLPPSYAASPAGQTISSRAYGVGSAGPGAGPRTAAYGTVIAGVTGTVVLLFLWWTLPK